MLVSCSSLLKSSGQMLKNEMFLCKREILTTALILFSQSLYEVTQGTLQTLLPEKTTQVVLQRVMTISAVRRWMRASASTRKLGGSSVMTVTNGVAFQWNLPRR